MNSKHVTSLCSVQALERSKGTVHELEEELLSAQDAWEDYLTLKKIEAKEYLQQKPDLNRRHQRIFDTR